MGVGFTEEEADYVRSLHNGDTNQLRLLHYPPAMAQDVGHDQSRLGAHTDWRYDRSPNSRKKVVELILTLVFIALLRSCFRTPIKVSSSWIERLVNSWRRRLSLTRCT